METLGPVRSVGAWARLVAGLAGFAAAICLMIRSGLGLGPWDAFHVGISLQTGISVGAASILAGVAIVAGSWFVGARPGPGTLANMVLIGLFLDGLLPWTPAAPGLAAGFAYYGVAVALCGLSTGLYIAPGLGKGPRDGLMLAVSARSGWSVRRVRTLIELSALAFGWAMGGAVGIGTVIFALGIGPAVQWGLRVNGVPDAAAPRAAEP